MKLRKITEEELKTIIENHGHWLKKDCVGWERMRADLTYCDLRNSSLRGVNLRGGNLSNSDIRDSNLSCADLVGCNLSHCDLRNTYMRGSYINSCNLSYSDIGDCYLNHCDLRGVENFFVPLACPSHGSFVGWKKASGMIVKLLIPEHAKRVSATGLKCRCDTAKVLEIQDLNGNKANVERVRSNYESNFFYTVGEIVAVTNFCENRFNEYSAGIHFFMERKVAVMY